MFVKYYGRNRIVHDEVTDKWIATDEPAITVFHALDSIKLSESPGDRSACLLMVPGTVDLEERHVW